MPAKERSKQSCDLVAIDDRVYLAYFSFFNDHISMLSLFDDFHTDITLNLIEKLEREKKNTVNYSNRWIERLFLN